MSINLCLPYVSPQLRVPLSGTTGVQTRSSSAAALTDENAAAHQLSYGVPSHPVTKPVTAAVPQVSAAPTTTNTNALTNIGAIGGARLPRGPVRVQTQSGQQQQPQQVSSRPSAAAATGEDENHHGTTVSHAAAAKPPTGAKAGSMTRLPLQPTQPSSSSASQLDLRRVPSQSSLPTASIPPSQPPGKSPPQDSLSTSTSSTTTTTNPVNAFERTAFSEFLLALPSATSIDTSQDPQQVCEYVQEIYAYLGRVEAREKRFVDYLLTQQELKAADRFASVEWLVKGAFTLNLRDDTILLAVDIMDRFLAKKLIGRTRLRLVAVASLLIAAKYEEVMCPRLDDFLFASEDEFDLPSLLKMERVILAVLDFVLQVPTPVAFLRRLQKLGPTGAAGSDPLVSAVATYVILVSAHDYDQLRVLPSHTAGAAYLLALRVCGYSWTPLISQHSGLEERALTPTVDLLLSSCRVASRGGMPSLTEKYGNTASHHHPPAVLEILRQYMAQQPSR